MTVCVCVVHVLFNRLYGIIQSRYYMYTMSRKS